MSSLVSWLHERKPRFGLAFSPRELFVAEFNGSSVTSIEAYPLPEGSIRSGSRDPNMASVASVATHLDSLRAERPSPRDSAVMLVPDLSIAAEVVDGPAAREQLLSRCGLPNEDLRFDTWSPPGGGVLATAVRGPVAAQYEAVRSALGYQPGWVDSVSVALLPVRAVEKEHQSAVPSVELTVFPEHYTLAVFHSGRLVEYRRKLQPRQGLEAGLGSTVSELARLSRVLELSRIGFVGVSGWRAEELAAAIRGETELAIVADVERVEVRTGDEKSLVIESLLALTARVP